MKLLDAITTIKAGIDTSAEAQDDLAWKAAVEKAGLVSQGDKGTTGLDETYSATFGPLELRVRHTWRDTSKTFQIGPDRTKLTLDLVHGGTSVDSYSNGYEA
ncbi:hypothetical protein [Rhizobium ruizarguesonis]|uniref:hypothetical protein n=1 Tax=Rhizobium ruizarguesonis TaxID=2081791 RepID=UPI0013DFB0A4|nr:hypothetical protein [Rhizobium ruizarguesonis]NEJ94345.1 hypothetical protein [Rhizobium ruizarguesonis]